ncbi:universal stress protein [Halanaeroarchaeum sulfurireducens]|uniref:UspA domain-containing protein n=1 Tax=Halanaeroarchaeum sulfurireducens TaxID=1604004 RepID=A0A0F7P6H7_9EURY|nr:universal stress protein [Halanaeroarchaeum sulfurireducens]AKH96766.1 UspA domain-containing protein [Halanaeroarchaeum sulfurireducens]ALG81168.1 UspA domain-containing protein [Halanaeroarchaeum sulfurireducens]
MTLAVDMVLVPVDGSEASADAAEYAMTIAERYDADVHVLYVVGDSVARGIEGGDLDRTDIADETLQYVEKIAALADDPDRVQCSMAYGYSTVRKTHHPGSVVLDTAEDLDVDFVVIPRESTTGGQGDVLEKVAEYVLLYASQPVLSV